MLKDQYSALTIVVAVTSTLRVAALPVGVLLKAGEGGLAHDSAVHCGHIYTVDKKRIGRRLGQLTAARMAEVQALADYNKVRAQLSFAEGSTMEKHHLRLDTPWEKAPKR